jgi:hypothetical protein
MHSQQMRSGRALLDRDAGEGVPFNPQLGWALVRAAAERGDAEAQSDLGFRLALGIVPPAEGARRLLCTPLASLCAAR